MTSFAAFSNIMGLKPESQAGAAAMLSINGVSHHRACVRFSVVHAGKPKYIRFNGYINNKLSSDFDMNFTKLLLGNFVWCTAHKILSCS